MAASLALPLQRRQQQQQVQAEEAEERPQGRRWGRCGGRQKKRECVAHLQLPAIHRHELHLKVKGGAAWDDAACTAGTIAVLAGDHAAEKV
jgi:hypothetical protein